jgi:hypothetical protein
MLASSGKLAAPTRVKFLLMLKKSEINQSRINMTLLARRR